MVAIDYGRVVIGMAGKEKGFFYVALGTDKEGRIYIADGDRRKLEKPKAKNLKHLQMTSMQIDMTAATNKKLRQQLRSISTQNLRKTETEVNGEVF